MANRHEYDGNLAGKPSSLVVFASWLLFDKVPSKKYDEIVNMERLSQ
jgi:hypothetical protein